ncbi:hypothetical protein BpHYR1_031331 [Brachionus plicatilis]|uniref:Uncharacterized protein n=1 Tax=Brachionus plicatilis TaxID=10195 RepID=A0A3M7QR76_BRAPC|nr:hypothetical protein BpHYR1_031331 [Brachionus plicatilis]
MDPLLLKNKTTCSRLIERFSLKLFNCFHLNIENTLKIFAGKFLKSRKRKNQNSAKYFQQSSRCKFKFFFLNSLGANKFRFELCLFNIDKLSLIFDLMKINSYELLIWLYKV